MKPTLGRIVFYTFEGTGKVAPAMVVKVYGDDCVNLRVFTDDGENPAYKSSVRLGEVGKPDSWAWPPR